MLRAFSVLFVLPVLALAAPVPKERPNERMLREFGTVVDPDKDTSFALDGSKLKISVPAGEHNFVPGKGLANAPRITRSVEGDFVALVRIRMYDGPVADGGGRLLAQAGMFVGSDEQNFAFHARSLEVQQGGLRRNGRHGGWINGNANGGGSSGGGHFDPEAVYFRIKRIGNKLLFAAVPDANAGNWHEFGGPTVNLPEKVTFGLFVTNSTKQAFTVEFDELSITSTPAAK